MARKSLQDLANALCQTAVGSQLAGTDLESLAALADGELLLSAMSGHASHSSGVPVNLRLSTNLQAWLESRLASLSIGEEKVDAATVRVVIRTDRIKTDRTKLVSFDGPSSFPVEEG